MEYSIQELSHLSGVTTRTLRWYDQIGLLKPSRVAESGYRYYGKAEVDRLQDILYYRALGVELARVKECLDDPSFDRLAALRNHLAALEAKRERLENAVRGGVSPESEDGKEITALHRRWLTITGNRYDPAKHRGIAELYVMDERFTAYYDKHLPGCALFAGRRHLLGKIRIRQAPGVSPGACLYFLFGFRLTVSRRMKSSNNEVSVGSNISHFPSW